MSHFIFFGAQGEVRGLPLSDWKCLEVSRARTGPCHLNSVSPKRELVLLTSCLMEILLPALSLRAQYSQVEE